MSICKSITEMYGLLAHSADCVRGNVHRAVLCKEPFLIRSLYVYDVRSQMVIGAMQFANY